MQYNDLIYKKNILNMKHLKKFESFHQSEQSINLEKELNVIDTIKRGDILGYVPKDAEYALLAHNDKIQKIYKFDDVNFNDGEVKRILKYWGEQGGWHPSSYNDRDSKDYKKLKDAKFLKIID